MTFSILANKRKIILKGCLIFVIALIFFAWLQSSNFFPDPDSFYHAKMAILLKEQKITSEFPWLQYTVIKDNFSDHHFLYHLILIPFVAFDEPLIGLKIATAIFAALLIMTIYYFLIKNKVPYAFWFSIFLLAINPFIFRASLAKASAFSLIILTVFLYFLFENKIWPLFFISFVYVWSYGGWPLLLILMIFYLMARAIKKTLKWRHWQQFWNVGAGALLGLIINPFFPQNIKFYWYQIVQIAIFNFKDKIGVGSEWYPYGFLDLINNASLLFILLTIIIIFFIINIKKQSTQTIFLFLCFLFFWILTLKSRRNVEYFIPFALLFSAFAFRDSLPNPKRQILNFFKNLKKEKNYITITALCVFFIMIVTIACRDIKKAKDELSHGFKMDKYQKAAIWLKENTPAQSIVFHNDWDDFPMLFYYNNSNYYIVGLDPTFMYLYNKDLYQTWADITLGKTSKNLYNIIKKDFKAEYVFIDTDHKTLEQNIKNDGQFIKVYQDNEVTVYH